MSSSVHGPDQAGANRLTTVGIDVGGPRKGFHAVALVEGQYAAHFGTCDAVALARWCRETVGARVIAVDAPCRWSFDGCGRPAERQMNSRGIKCFYTPTKDRAVGHASNYYGWMLQGAAMFEALEPSHPLSCEIPAPNGQPYCFETFPHAIAWHLMAGKAVARNKKRERRALLAAAGIDLTRLTNIDLIDAALCALVAHHAGSGRLCRGYGERDTGVIVVPEEQIIGNSNVREEYAER